MSKAKASDKTATPSLLAYRVQVRDWPEAVGIYAAASAAKAKYKSCLAAKDAGYSVEFRHLIARRAPEYDGVIKAGAMDSEWTGWTEEFAEERLAATETVKSTELDT